MTAQTIEQPHEDEVDAGLPEEEVEDEDYVPVDEDEKVCKEMVSELSAEELEHAARSSYRYFMASTKKENESYGTPDERERHAIAMARRHLVAEKGNRESAMKKFRNAIAYRREVDVDGIRRCFYDLDDEETKEKYAEYRKHFESVASQGSRYVQGYNRKGCALYVSEAAKDNFDEGMWVIKYCVYTLERALAASERSTDATEEKVIAMFNYNGYGYSNNPPLHLVKELMTVLRDHYPERLEHVLLVDAPLVFRVFYKIVYPFIDKITRKKVKFVTGEEQKKRVLSEYIEDKEAAPWMFAGGTKDKPMDAKDYLYNIPFDHAFDEEA